MLGIPNVDTLIIWITATVAALVPLLICLAACHTWWTRSKKQGTTPQFRMGALMSLPILLTPILAWLGKSESTAARIVLGVLVVHVGFGLIMGWIHACLFTKAKHQPAQKCLSAC